jgi:serine/threonine-protein kinase SRPK3
VWLVADLVENRYAALKIVKSATNYTEAAQDEIKMLRAVRKHDGVAPGGGHVVQLYDDFVVRRAARLGRARVCVCVCVCVC